MGLVHFEIFDRHFWNQYEAIHFVSFYMLGYCAIAIGSRFWPSKGGGVWIIRPILALVPPLLALAFVSTAYFCPVCSNPTYPVGCEIGVSGVPFPSRHFPINLSYIGPPTQSTDSCGEWSNEPYGYVELNTATLGNFLLGLGVLPLLSWLARFSHKRPKMAMEQTSGAS